MSLRPGPLTDQEWALVDRVPGWLNRTEADLLAKYSRAPWCEVGAYKGRSTQILARAGYGYAVDTFLGSGEPECPVQASFRDDIEMNLVRAGLISNVCLVEGPLEVMHEYMPHDLELLFLDAAHSYEETKQAWDLFTPLLSQQGLVILHDVWHDDLGYPTPNVWTGVSQFVLEILDGREWEAVQHASRCAVLARRGW